MNYKWSSVLHIFLDSLSNFSSQRDAFFWVFDPSVVSYLEHWAGVVGVGHQTVAK